MITRLRWAWARLNANYWFYPALFALSGAALAFACIYLDRSGLAEALNRAEWLAPARPEGAFAMLSVIAGSTLAVAGTVFSITIVAVSFASGTYGPRLLTNFMEDKGNQLSLATFIGTFVYALTVLRAVRAEGEGVAGSASAASGALPGFVPQLSLLVAYLLMALSVAVLVFFLNHVPSGIRIDNVLQGIGKRLIAEIRDIYPDNGNREAPPERPGGAELLATAPGYVQMINFSGLEEVAAEAGCKVSLSLRTGDFAHPGLPLAEVSGSDIGSELPAELAEALRECFTQGFARTPEQDPQFLIDELVEIGLRALSPGINDPFTAITALHWLGAATAELGARNLIKIHGASEGEGEERLVFPLPDDFAHYVERGFGALRSGAATSPIAAQVMLDTLGEAARTIDAAPRRQMLLAEGTRLRDQARNALAGPDLIAVEHRYESFVKALG